MYFNFISFPRGFIKQAAARQPEWGPDDHLLISHLSDFPVPVTHIMFKPPQNQSQSNRQPGFNQHTDQGRLNVSVTHWFMFFFSFLTLRFTTREEQRGMVTSRFYSLENFTKWSDLWLGCMLDVRCVRCMHRRKHPTPERPHSSWQQTQGESEKQLWHKGTKQ